MLLDAFALPWWVPVVFAFVEGTLTNACVTLYLHRDQTHGGLHIKAPLSHVMRLWLWLKVGQNTREWVACHRKHHAFADQPEDPHSPVNHGILGILFFGSQHYLRAVKDRGMIDKYGKGTVSDWLEDNLFGRFQYAGFFVSLAIDLLLFGPKYGALVWGIQMLWIPTLAVALINGVGHWAGYRRYEVPDQSRNLVPWGVLLAGEELHHNHHRFPGSAKFSQQWYEFDLGWLYVRVLMLLGLATTKRESH